MVTRGLVCTVFPFLTEILLSVVSVTYGQLGPKIFTENSRMYKFQITFIMVYCYDYSLLLLVIIFYYAFTLPNWCLLSSVASTLSKCGHAVVATLYPFTWQHTYIPVLPASMIDIVCSPTPFLIGILSCSLPQLQDLPIEEVRWKKCYQGKYWNTKNNNWSFMRGSILKINADIIVTNILLWYYIFLLFKWEILCYTWIQSFISFIVMNHRFTHLLWQVDSYF